MDQDNKGWTITYIPWESLVGHEVVAGRFKTTEEKDNFLNNINKFGSGWMEEELMTLSVYNDYDYSLPV